MTRRRRRNPSSANESRYFIEQLKEAGINTHGLMHLLLHATKEESPAEIMEGVDATLQEFQTRKKPGTIEEVDVGEGSEEEWAIKATTTEGKPPRGKVANLLNALNTIVQDQARDKEVALKKAPPIWKMIFSKHRKSLDDGYRTKIALLREKAESLSGIERLDYLQKAEDLELSLPKREAMIFGGTYIDDEGFRKTYLGKSIDDADLTPAQLKRAKRSAFRFYQEYTDLWNEALAEKLAEEIRKKRVAKALLQSKAARKGEHLPTLARNYDILRNEVGLGPGLAVRLASEGNIDQLRAYAVSRQAAREHYEAMLRFTRFFADLKQEYGAENLWEYLDTRDYRKLSPRLKRLRKALGDLPGAKSKRDRKLVEQAVQQAVEGYSPFGGPRRFSKGGCLITVNGQAERGELPPYLETLEKGRSKGFTKTRAIIDVTISKSLFEDWIVPYEYLIKTTTGFDPAQEQASALVEELGKAPRRRLQSREQEELLKVFEISHLPPHERQERYDRLVNREGVIRAVIGWRERLEKAHEEPSHFVFKRISEWRDSFEFPEGSGDQLNLDMYFTLEDGTEIDASNIVSKWERGRGDLVQGEVEEEDLNEWLGEQLPTTEAAIIVARGLGIMRSPYAWKLAKKVHNKLTSLLVQRNEPKSDLSPDQRALLDSRSTKDLLKVYTNKKGGRTFPVPLWELRNLPEDKLIKVAERLEVIRLPKSPPTPSAIARGARVRAQRASPKTAGGRIVRNLAESIYCARETGVDSSDEYRVWLNTETATLFRDVLINYADYPLSELEAGAQFTVTGAGSKAELERHTKRARKFIKDLAKEATELATNLTTALMEVTTPKGERISIQSIKKAMLLINPDSVRYLPKVRGSQGLGCNTLEGA